ncbi:MAG: hypothetical protein ACXVBE_16140, partial [Bdellovibrionota bacterium]
MVKKSISLALIGISLLSISGCASSQTRNVAASSFGDPISHPNACVAESLHPQIENELAVLGDLAACPEGEGFRLVPSTLPAQAVFLGYSAKHPLFLKQIIPILARSPASSQINFFVKHAEIGEARKFLSEIPDAQSLHFLELPFEPAWPQDFIVMGITGKNPPKPTLLNLPYEHAPKLPEAVAHACNISQVAPKFPASEIKENNDFGGNIVPFPGNVVVIGSG